MVINWFENLTVTNVVELMLAMAMATLVIGMAIENRKNRLRRLRKERRYRY